MHAVNDGISKTTLEGPRGVNYPIIFDRTQSDSLLAIAITEMGGFVEENGHWFTVPADGEAVLWPDLSIKGTHVIKNKCMGKWETFFATIRQRFIKIRYASHCAVRGTKQASS